MARDDKQLSAEEQLGAGRWDVIKMLEAQGRQIAHLETLLKQKEDADQKRHKDLKLHLNGLASMIASVPSTFWFRPLAWFRWWTVAVEPRDIRLVESAQEAMEERAQALRAGYAVKVDERGERL